MGNYILNGSGIKKRLGKYILYKHVFQKLYTFDQIALKKRIRIAARHTLKKSLSAGTVAGNHT